MNNDEKLNYIYALEDLERLSERDELHLIDFLSDENAEVRYSACETLALFPSVRNEHILCEMLNDHDRLVRACVCDALAFGRTKETLNALMKACHDRTVLVRGYAILSLADVQSNQQSAIDETVLFLLAIEKKEQSTWVLICLYRSLFLLHQDTYGEKLLAMLDHRCYKNRCLVLNLIAEIIDKQMDRYLPNLECALSQRLSIETAGSVRDKLHKVIGVLRCKANENHAYR